MSYLHPGNRRCHTFTALQKANHTDIGQIDEPSSIHSQPPGLRQQDTKRIHIFNFRVHANLDWFGASNEPDMKLHARLPTAHPGMNRDDQPRCRKRTVQPAVAFPGQGVSALLFLALIADGNKGWWYHSTLPANGGQPPLCSPLGHRGQPGLPSENIHQGKMICALSTSCASAIFRKPSPVSSRV